MQYQKDIDDCCRLLGPSSGFSGPPPEPPFHRPVHSWDRLERSWGHSGPSAGLFWRRERGPSRARIDARAVRAGCCGRRGGLARPREALLGPAAPRGILWRRPGGRGSEKPCGAFERGRRPGNVLVDLRLLLPNPFAFVSAIGGGWPEAACCHQQQAERWLR